MTYKQALSRLAKFFQVTEDTFEENLPKAERQGIIMAWARRTFDPKYQLSIEEHNFLIGRGYAA